MVNLTNSPTFDDASPAFFGQTMDNLLAAAKAAGVGHAVILSIVGADLVPGLVYYRAKVLQEDILKSGPVPYSIVRATQFFEFIDAVLSWTADENTVRLPATLVQPMAAADVAQAVADVSAAAPPAGHPQRRRARGVPARRAGQDHPRRSRGPSHRHHRQQRGHVRRCCGRRPDREGRRRHRQDHLPGVAGALTPAGPARRRPCGPFVRISDRSTPVPAAQFGRVEHDPEDAQLGTGHRDADYRDGLPGAAQRQPGLAVDGLEGHVGIRLPTQQDHDQTGDVLGPVNGICHGGFQPAAVAYGDSIGIQHGPDRADVSRWQASTNLRTTSSCRSGMLAMTGRHAGL